MKRILLTGMSGVGKSTVLARLAALGYRTIDTDDNGFTLEVRSDAGTERLWREDRIRAVLALDDADLMFVSGTCRNQVKFYPQFDRIVLLSAPLPLLVERLRTRSNNPYGKSAGELAETLHLVGTVEPLLRAVASLEVDTSAPVDEVVSTILRHVSG